MGQWKASLICQETNLLSLTLRNLKIRPKIWPSHCLAAPLTFPRYRCSLKTFLRSLVLLQQQKKRQKSRQPFNFSHKIQSFNFPSRSLSLILKSSFKGRSSTLKLSWLQRKRETTASLALKERDTITRITTSFCEAGWAMYCWAVGSISHKLTSKFSLLKKTRKYSLLKSQWRCKFWMK